MTRADGSAAAIRRQSFGRLGAQRTVVVLRTGATAMLDPDPAVTARRDIRVLAIGLPPGELDDPATFGGQTQAQSAAAGLAAVVRGEAGESPVGVVGYGRTGELAVMLAQTLGEGVDRLALVAVPAPGTEIDRDDQRELLAQVTAKTLIMNGQNDPDAAAAAARWHHDRLPSSRVEMVPAAAVSSPDGRLPLSAVWDRVLSHVAPGTKAGT
jgi:pimeloyl-ACP methyl ester carboxylesterase